MHDIALSLVGGQVLCYKSRVKRKRTCPSDQPELRDCRNVRFEVPCQVQATEISEAAVSVVGGRGARV